MTQFPKHSLTQNSFLALVLAIFLAPFLYAEEPQALPTVQTVKLLTIGNSFADDATAYLPKMAEMSGKKVVLFKANLGGHSLQQHVGYLQAYDADPNDPKGRPYKNKTDPATGQKRDFSLREALEMEKWDYVTIQQVSYNSYKLDTYEPYAGTLISYIQKYAPSAKILIHQTWEYRSDAPLYAKEKLTAEQMFSGLKLAYSKVAQTYNLGIIPVGEAFHTAVAMPRWNTVSTDPNYDYKNPKPGVLPMQSASLYRGYVWEKDKKTGADKFVLDTKHASPSGRYLGACVFYNMLFQEQPIESFVPEKVDPLDAPVLRRVAYDVVKAHTATSPTMQLTAGK